jgi:hypothetical protein
MHITVIAYFLEQREVIFSLWWDLGFIFVFTKSLVGWDKKNFENC